MRKQQQRQILDLLRTIEEAQTARMYADCGEGARAVRDFIESIEGKGAATAGLLDKYAGLLEDARRGGGVETLRRVLGEIRDSVKTELKPNRLEIVFLSYKASMSDSIESIYMAARADPVCDAYWIPIPYYERQPDGAFGEMLYEGASCYGKNIECTDWRQYDLAARRPDVIFTFNPYDDGNYVTSVHPYYYCQRLRDMTDMLVYIPYFVTSGDVPEHFCTLAGCVYAHKVIVQSEAIRDTYVRVFKEAYGERFGKPEDKFLALGSPKFDKVLNTRREDCDLPDGWRKLLEGRKAVFYNTSVGALLAGGEQYLKKLRHVLDTFRNRGDVVLWWRPHPLNEATYKAMRPHLRDEYARIVDDYRRAAFGIYDDTPDLHRAIAWTDAYYGDGSSVVALYEATGKSVMVQRVACTQPWSAPRARLYISALCEGGDYYYFAETLFGGLFRADKTTWKTEFIGFFPGEDITRACLYADIFEYEDKLFFLPHNAKRFAIYDLRSGAFRQIDVSAPALLYPGSARAKINADDAKFTRFHMYGKYLYCIPWRYPAIARIDAELETVEYLSDWAEPFFALNPAAGFGFFGWGMIDGGVLLAPAAYVDVVLRVDMETGAATLDDVPSGNGGSNVIAKAGDRYYLFSTARPQIAKWAPSSGEIEILDNFPAEFRVAEKFYNFVYSYQKDGYIHAIRHSASNSLKISIHTDEISVDDELLVCAEAIYNVDRVSDYIYLMSNVQDFSVNLYNPDTNEISSHEISVSSDEADRIFSAAAGEGERSFLESEIFSPLRLIKNIDSYNFRPNLDEPGERAGDSIYRFFMGEWEKRIEG